MQYETELLNGYVYKNGVLLASLGETGYGATVSGSGTGLAVTAGDTIDFVLGRVGSGYAVTQLAATISYVPEPPTLALLVAGLSGLLCYAWRKRQQRVPREMDAATSGSRMVDGMETPTIRFYND